MAAHRLQAIWNEHPQSEETSCPGMGRQNQHEYAARVWQSRTIVEVVQEDECLGCSDMRGRI